MPDIPFTIHERALTVSEYQSLRNSTNWNSFSDDLVEKAIQNDLYSIVITINDRAIGMGRVIGDGALYFYIQDLIVKAEYRNQGIARLIMEHIENYLQKNAETNAFIGLMAAKDVKGLYEKFGYKQRAKDSPGMYKYLE